MSLRNKLIILLLIITIAFVGWKIMGGNTGGEGDNSHGTPESDPIDIVLDFYNPWLAAELSTSTNPHESDLQNSSLLTKELAKNLSSSAEYLAAEINPVLCQSEVPERIGGKLIFVTEKDAEVMVVPRGKKVPQMAIVSLIIEDNEWIIDGIECSQGDVLPDREFSFENEGFLLRQSVQAPLNPEDWHLVFIQDDEEGHTAPLHFDTESMCTDEGGIVAVCSKDQFTEASKVIVKGEMTEAGVQVKQVELLP